jgi:hypothetical protein
MAVIFALVFLAGFLGGGVNALMSDNGFPLPRREIANGTTILRPGVLGTALVGGVGALISWGLYGPAAGYLLVGETPSGSPPLPPLTLTVGAFTGAILVGVGGARWLTREVDTRLLRATAVEAAGRVASADAARRIGTASPAQALDVARNMDKAS